MAHRLDIELTSDRGDGSWSWRAAGAKEPKGSLDGSLLPTSAKVGDQFRAEADFSLDGIDVHSVTAKKVRKESALQTLELIGSGHEEPLVTQQLVRGRRSGHDRDHDRDRDDGRRGRDRGKNGRGDRSGPGSPRGSERRDTRGDRDSRRNTPPGDRAPRRDGGSSPDRTKSGGGGTKARTRRPKLRPGREHRNAAVAALSAEQRPLAEVVLRGGVPAVRQIIEEQHALAKSGGHPLLALDPLVGLAERLAPRLKAADWLDRADAALERVNECELRDLRSVVASAASAEREEGAHDKAQQLRQALTERVDREHRDWLAELAGLLSDGRIVRALKRSSEPPKAGAPLPADIADGLAEQATAGLTGDIAQDRFAAVLDAVSFSPVHERVAAKSIPSQPSEELLKKVRQVAKRVPGVAAQFGVTPTPSPPRSK